MPDLIFLRLLPAKPIAPDTFRDLITGRVITVFDLSVTSPASSPSVGTQIGNVSKLAGRGLGIMATQAEGEPS